MKNTLSNFPTGISHLRCWLQGSKVKGAVFSYTNHDICLFVYFVSFLLHQMTRRWHCQGAKSHNTGCATECQYFHLVLLLNNIQKRQQYTRSLYLYINLPLPFLVSLTTAFEAFCCLDSLAKLYKAELQLEEPRHLTNNFKGYLLLADPWLRFLASFVAPALL